MAMPLDNSAMQPLLQMLVNIQRQNQIEKAQVGPVLGQGIGEMLQGFQRQGDLGRERTFRTQEREADARARYEEAERQRDFMRRQAKDRYSVTGARQRRTEQEQRRQFGIAQRADEENRLLTRLGFMEQQLREYGESGQTPPPEFLAGLNALRKRTMGFGGPGAVAPPAQAPPVAAPPPAAGLPDTTLGEIVKKKAAMAVEAMKNAEARRDIAIANTEDVRPFVTKAYAESPDYSGALSGKYGGGVRERAGAQEETERYIAGRAAHIGRILEEGGQGTFKLKDITEADIPKSVPGKMLRQIAIQIANGVTDENALVAAAMRTGQLEWNRSAEAQRLRQGPARASGAAPGRFTDMTPEDLRGFIRYIKAANGIG